MKIKGTITPPSWAALKQVMVGRDLLIRALEGPDYMMQEPKSLTQKRPVLMGECRKNQTYGLIHNKARYYSSEHVYKNRC